MCLLKILSVDFVVKLNEENILINNVPNKYHAFHFCDIFFS